MKKIIIAILSLVVLLLAGGGGYFYFYKIKHQSKTVESVVIEPILFAQIDNLVVSVQQTQGNNTDSDGGETSPNPVFVEISIQFSTNNQKAVDDFNALLPIIQSQIVNFLMKETSDQIMNPNLHDKLCSSLLSIANKALNKNQDFKPENPFLQAYITNIVQQS